MNPIYTRLSPFGVPLYLNPISLIWIFFFIHMGILNAIAATLMLVLSLVIHEYAHVFAGLKRGFNALCVETNVLGAAARFGNSFDGDPKSEALIAAAGPAASLALSILFGFAGVITGSGTILWLSYINLILAIFNLVPLFPMDGGRILRACLSFFIGKFKATRAATYTTLVLGICGTIAAAIYLRPMDTILIGAICAVMVFSAWKEMGVVCGE